MRISRDCLEIICFLYCHLEKTIAVREPAMMAIMSKRPKMTCVPWEAAKQAASQNFC